MENIRVRKDKDPRTARGYHSVGPGEIRQGHRARRGRVGIRSLGEGKISVES